MHQGIFLGRLNFGAKRFGMVTQMAILLYNFMIPGQEISMNGETSCQLDNWFFQNFHLTNPP